MPVLCNRYETVTCTLYVVDEDQMIEPGSDTTSAPLIRENTTIGVYGDRNTDEDDYVYLKYVPDEITGYQSIYIEGCALYDNQYMLDNYGKVYKKMKKTTNWDPDSSYMLFSGNLETRQTYYLKLVSYGDPMFISTWKCHKVNFHSNYPSESNMEEDISEEYIDGYKGLDIDPDNLDYGWFENNLDYFVVGWKTVNGQEVSLDENFKPDSDTDLYAVWNRKPTAPRLTATIKLNSDFKIGQTAEFTITIKNVSDSGMDFQVFDWYYREKDNSETYPGVDFGNVYYSNGIEYDEMSMIHLDINESVVFAAKGIVPDTWSEKSEMLFVMATRDVFYSQVGYTNEQQNDVPVSKPVEQKADEITDIKSEAKQNNPTQDIAQSEGQKEKAVQTPEVDYIKAVTEKKTTVSSVTNKNKKSATIY